LNTYPKQVAWDIALLVIESRPPPLSFPFISLTKDNELVSLLKAQFVRIVSLIVIHCIHDTTVENAQLLLNTCNMWSVLQNKEGIKSETFKF
jgi:hypothetical protein